MEKFSLGIWFQNNQIKKFEAEKKKEKDPMLRLRIVEKIRIARVKRNILYRTKIADIRRKLCKS